MIVLIISFSNRPCVDVFARLNFKMYLRVFFCTLLGEPLGFAMVDFEGDLGSQF